MMTESSTPFEKIEFVDIIMIHLSDSPRIKMTSLSRVDK